MIDTIGKIIIGSDETGVGDYFTPLVVVAATIPKKNYEKVSKLGVKDSKELSDKKIKSLYFELKDLVKYKSKKLTQIGYNKLNKSFNAHELKTLLHTNAISELEKEVEPDLIIIDEFASRINWEKYMRHLESSSLTINKIVNDITFEQKAENKYLEVATASIIARAILLFEMKKQNEKWNMIFPLGASQKVDEIGKEFVKKHSLANLNKVAKISFKNTGRIDD